MYVKGKNGELGYTQKTIYTHTRDQSSRFCCFKPKTMIALFFIHRRSDFRGACDDLSSGQ